uniref:ARM repeat superfamily protein n=2 Tax=Caenorhabditis tropicalis TaxID=1561998 RepID=A0A1I7UDR7_9PELO
MENITELLPYLLEGMNSVNESIVYQSVVAVSEIIARSAENTAAVVDSAAIGPLLRLSTSNSCGIAKRAIFAISNIAATSQKYRDAVIQSERIKEAMRHWIDHFDDLGGVVIWSFSNFCVLSEIPAEIVPELLDGFSKIPINDRKAVELSIQSLQSLIKEHAELVKSSGILQKIVFSVKEAGPILAQSALRLLGSIDSVDVEMIRNLLETGDSGLILECCSQIFRICSKPENTIFDARFINILSEILENHQFEYQLEVSRIIYKISSKGIPDQIQEMVQLVPMFCRLLNHRSPDFLKNIMETLYIILFTVKHYWFDIENYREQIDGYGGVDAVANLLHHESKVIAEVADRIHNQFLNDDDWD